MPVTSISIRGGLFHGIDDHHSLHSQMDCNDDVQPLLTTTHPENKIALRRSSPYYEITEYKNGYIVAIDAKGVKPEDIGISLEYGGKLLRVYGHKHMHRGDTPVESRFDKTFTVHTNVDASKISANIHDGILIINCPKKDSTMARTIPITRVDHSTLKLASISSSSRKNSKRKALFRRTNR